MRATLFLIPLALSSAACSSADEMEKAAGVSSEAATASARAANADAVAFTANDKQGDAAREFSYHWPGQVSAHPALVRQFTAERDRTLAQEKSEWAAALKDSPADCVACRNLSFSKEWKVVADTPGYLSLSGDFATYTGGAHGMYGLESLIWDKTKQRAINGVELFRSPDALEAGLGAKLCAALNAEREKKRGEPVQSDASDPYGTGFDSCQHVKDSTVLVGSSNGRAFDRIGIWFGPYVAGSYAEGAYELNFPVDETVLKAVKPEYAGAFAARP